MEEDRPLSDNLSAAYLQLMAAVCSKNDRCRHDVSAPLLRRVVASLSVPNVAVQRGAVECILSLSRSIKVCWR